VADTFTPKLGLRQYDPLLNYDVNKFSADNLAIDNSYGAVICTSLTRPSTGLYDGMLLWETDTKRFVIRVSGAWVAVPTRVVVADVTARNALTANEGMQIYRQDKDWTETHDGTAWRVPNGTRVTALADVTHPTTGQYVVLSTDDLEYRYNGTGWDGVRLVAPHPVIERRLNASTGTGASSNFLIPFDTNVTTGVGITYNAGTKDFTFTRAGRYTFNCSVRRDINSEFYLWFAKSGAPAGNRGKDSQPGGGGLNRATSAKVRVAAGETWGVYCWSNPAVNLVRESGSTADDYAPYFSAFYDGPI
jgi:hypothetical protein